MKNPPITPQSTQSNRKSPRTKICKWYPVCPIKFFTDEGKLDPHWVRDYCLQGNPKCVRFQMEENYKFHPDQMLPDGTIDPSL